MKFPNYSTRVLWICEILIVLYLRLFEAYIGTADLYWINLPTLRTFSMKLRASACTGFLRFILLQFHSRALRYGRSLAPVPFVFASRFASLETRLSFAHHICTFRVQRVTTTNRCSVPCVRSTSLSRFCFASRVEHLCVHEILQ